MSLKKGYLAGLKRRRLKRRLKKIREKRILTKPKKPKNILEKFLDWFLGRDN